MSGNRTQEVEGQTGSGGVTVANGPGLEGVLSDRSLFGGRGEKEGALREGSRCQREGPPPTRREEGMKSSGEGTVISVKKRANMILPGRSKSARVLGCRRLRVPVLLGASAGPEGSCLDRGGGGGL